MLAPLEKSADQIAMEKAEKRNNLDINETRANTPVVTFASMQQPKNLNFTNSANYTNINTAII